MKRLIKRMLNLALVACILVSLTACSNLLVTYKYFYFENITSNLDEDYFTSDNFDFATVDSIVIIPNVKETDWGVYSLSIRAYSKTGEEKVVIKNATIKEDKLLLNYDLNKQLEFEKKSDELFEGKVDGYFDNVTFTEEQVEPAKGKRYEVIVGVEVVKDNKTTTKDIEFALVGYDYKWLNLPTV